MAGDLGRDFDGTAADGADVQAGREQVWSELKFGQCQFCCFSTERKREAGHV